MNRFFRSAIPVVLAALAWSATAAQAQTKKIKLTSGSGVPFNGVQVGPYRGMLISEPGTPTIDIYCVDFLNAAHLNQTWDANVTNLGSGNLGNTRLKQLFNAGATGFFGGDNVLTRYRKAAWLTTQFAIQNTSAWGGIHSAIWMLTTPSYTSTLPLAFRNAASYWIGEAAKKFTTIATSDVQILTDTRTYNGRGGTQEYIVVTPEPLSVLLLGSGLAGLYAARRRRNRLATSNSQS